MEAMVQGNISYRGLTSLTLLLSKSGMSFPIIFDFISILSCESSKFMSLCNDMVITHICMMQYNALIISLVFPYKL